MGESHGESTPGKTELGARPELEKGPALSCLVNVVLFGCFCFLLFVLGGGGPQKQTTDRRSKKGKARCLL